MARLHAAEDLQSAARSRHGDRALVVLQTGPMISK
jgi:hypothetical protein